MARFRILHIRDQSLPQCLPGEDVDAHGCEIALRFLRLLLEFHDLAALIRIHDAKTAGFLPRYRTNRNCQLGFLFLMELEHRIIVHFINVIARQYQQIIRTVGVNEINILGNGICSSAIDIEAFIGFFAGRQHEHATVLGIKTPASARCDVAVKKHGLILRQDTNYVDPAVRTVTEREIHDAVLAAE